MPVEREGFVAFAGQGWQRDERLHDQCTTQIPKEVGGKAGSDSERDDIAYMLTIQLILSVWLLRSAVIASYEQLVGEVSPIYLGVRREAKSRYDPGGIRCSNSFIEPANLNS